MPLLKVYIHFVWSTKNRIPFLDSQELRNKVWAHMKEKAREKGIFIDFINGYTDHCHCLVSLGFDQSIQKVMQLIKGESAYWINKQGLTKDKFEWQDAYYAASVSESNLDIVREYIKNQEEHHKRVPPAKAGGNSGGNLGGNSGGNELEWALAHSIRKADQ